MIFQISTASIFNELSYIAGNRDLCEYCRTVYRGEQFV